MARTEQELADFKEWMLQDDPSELTLKAWKRTDKWFRSGVLDQPTEEDLSMAMELLVSRADNYYPFSGEELEDAKSVVLAYEQYTADEIPSMINSFIMCVQGLVYQDVVASRDEKFKEELQQGDRQRNSDEAIHELQLGRLRHSDILKK